MIYLRESITNETPVYVSREKKPIIKLFHKKDNSLYMKDFNPAEFVGEELCIERNIRSAHYFLAGRGIYNCQSFIPYADADKMVFGVGIASRSFYEPGYQYKSVFDYGLEQYDKDIFDRMLLQTKKEENRQKLCDDMLQLMALDIYMGQTDRFANNYLFEVDKKQNIRLAPIYDFQHSLNSSSLGNDALSFGDLQPFHTYEECREFVRKYPQFGEYLESYLGNDLASTIRCAFAKRRMNVSDRAISYYKKFEEEQKAKIKRIVR